MGQGLERRKAISPRSFSVDLTFRSGISEEERRQVERALFAFGLLGGLGSRARKGFGSCSLTAITGDRCLTDPFPEPPTTLEEFRACLRRIVGRTAGGTPEISAFSDVSRIDVSLTERSALTVLDQAGQTMSEIRKAMGGDTALAVGVMQGTKPSRVPDRASFGLPLQFYFSREETKVFFEVQPAEDNARRDRRASPLFLHVHQLRGEVQNKYALIQTFLPARFLPQNDQVRAKASPGRSFLLRHASPNWHPITQYLDAYRGPREAGYLEVLP
jgi:CRISPR-associated protein Cmr1